MSILKAKNKSIFIEKESHYGGGNIKAEGRLVRGLVEEQVGNERDGSERQMNQVSSAMQT